MSKKGTGLGSLFVDSDHARENRDLRQQVAELQTQIEQLRGQQGDRHNQKSLNQLTESLTQQLAEVGGVHIIPIALIDPDDEQVRQTFPEAVIASRAQSLKTKKQQTPIIVIPQPNGRYKLFDGEVRWRASQLLQWQELKAVFLPIDEIKSKSEKLERQLVTSLHSQDLHDLDLAEALLEITILNYPSLKDRREEIPKILNTICIRLERSKRHLEIAEIRLSPEDLQTQWIESVCSSEDEQAVLNTILSLQLHPSSINKNVFPMLKLTADLKEAVHTMGLESGKAKELYRLSSAQLKLSEAKALKVRQDATQKVINERLSLIQTRNLVRNLLNQYAKVEPKEPTAKTTKLIQAIESIQTSQIAAEDLESLRQSLQKKLSEIEAFLAQ